MAKEVIINICIIQASELLTQIVLDLSETAKSAKEIISHKDNFSTFSTHLEKTSEILKQLSSQSLDRSEASPALKRALEILGREVKSAKRLVLECLERNKIYLLLNSRKIAERLERSSREIDHALSLIPLASLDFSLSINAKIAEIRDEMSRSEYRSNGGAEEEILETFELSRSDELLSKIAEALGVSPESSELRREFEESIRAMEQQVAALLEKPGGEITTMATTNNNNSEEREKKYFSRRDSLGSQKLEPLQGFVCVLTQTVMDDPVETSSGQTFERRAIEKWIADGNELCPLTNARLDGSHLRPNRTLKQSIEEWRDRNSIIAIAALKQKLYLGDDEEEVSRGLSKLRDLCQQGEYYRECIEIEDFVPVIVGLLGGKNREVRTSALVTLCVLASQREENKEKIIEVQNALEYIVRSLARQPEESKSALRLLLDLSKSERARNLIGNVHGCILIVVTKLTSDDEEVSRDAQELINVLSFLEHNVKQMAKANHFKPLLQLLGSGPEDVKIRMAETLAEIELTDHSKQSIVDDGAVKPLIQMLSEDDLENKKVAIKCLLQLSSLPRNASSMFDEGLIGPLFEILYCHSLQSPLLREQVAATIMNLSLSITSDDLNCSENIRILQSEDDVFKFFSLVSLTGDDIKRSILGTFIALCQSPSGLDIRTSLRQISAVRVLVQLSEAENLGVRANALKLFYCLTKDNNNDEDSFSEHIGQNFIETLLRIIQTSNDSDEISSSLGIIAYLPKAQHITQWLINAEALKTIHDCLSDRIRGSSQRNQISENGVAAFRRFTISTNIEWQNRVAQVGVIGLLVHFLGSGTDFTKQSAAVSLKQLSESSKGLSEPVKRGSGFLCCVSFSSETGCPVHLGICGTESSFCLLEAKAVEPLVTMLGERDLETREASLDALLTLVDPLKPEIGGNLLDKANAIMPIINMLGSNCVRVQEKCLKGLEVIFRDDGLIKKYGKSVQMPLVDITSQMRAIDQREIRSLAATLLSRLGVLGIQSSFF